MKFNERLAAALTDAGMTHKELEKKIGLTRSAMSLWRHKDAHYFNPTNLVQAARELKVEPEWLREEKGPMKAGYGNNDTAQEETRGSYTKGGDVTPDERMRYVIAMQAAVAAMAAEIGIAPKDLVDQSAEARKRIAAAISSKHRSAFADVTLQPGQVNQFTGAKK